VHALPTVPIAADEMESGSSVMPFYALSAEGYANCSGGEVEAWAMLQHDKVLVQALERLHVLSASAPRVASHSDIRLDQFLICGDDIFVIDWEEFRYDDPARDLGTLVGELLHTAAHRMFSELDLEPGLAPGAAHEAIIAFGQQQVARVQEHVQAVWNGYRSAARTDPGLATRATAYAGWHFFDRLLARALHGAKLSAAERGMAGIGRNALVTPERFAAPIGLGSEGQ
jgi:aminoglycoside phosphotransferase (APT) family kinase protein